MLGDLQSSLIRSLFLACKKSLFLGLHALISTLTEMQADPCRKLYVFPYFNPEYTQNFIKVDTKIIQFKRLFTVVEEH